MNTVLFGKQSTLAWIWVGCEVITLIDHSIAAINFDPFGAVAAMGFVAPILLVILYVVAVVFGL